MKPPHLCEDKLPSRLSVTVSSQINKDINAIEVYNQNNAEALSQWHDYIEGIMRYISNPAIAWDYVGRYPHFPNGAIYVNDFGYDAAFIVKTNFKTNQTFVYLFKLNLNLEAFGLKMPPLKEENLLSVTKSDIKNMVLECVCRILSEKVKKYRDSSIYGWKEMEKDYKENGVSKHNLKLLRKSYNQYGEECAKRKEIPNGIGFHLWTGDKDVKSCEQGKGNRFPDYVD